MNREHFDHAVRAAAAVLGVTELLVIGSQAVHGSLSDPLREEAQRSVEVDVVPFDDRDGAKADLIDGSIGEASMSRHVQHLRARRRRDDCTAAGRLARSPRSACGAEQRGGCLVSRAPRSVGVEGDRGSARGPRVLRRLAA